VFYSHLEVDGVQKTLQLYLDPEDPTQYVIPCKISEPDKNITEIFAANANGTVCGFN